MLYTNALKATKMIIFFLNFNAFASEGAHNPTYFGFRRAVKKTDSDESCR